MFLRSTFAPEEIEKERDVIMEEVAMYLDQPHLYVQEVLNETLWPEFLEFSQTLQSYLSEVTERIVSQVICQDSSEAEVIEEPKRLSSSIDPDHLEAMEAEDLR